ncbi:MAG: DUF3418 domain-containing protein, partial [Planctomycetales bacterium]|nr:DUF3418 domain-containing protein [Planctomycetales bacterium]
FEPGHAADGVTVTVPQAALRQLNEEALGWLVPGLLEEKLLHLIRALPKSLRTNFVPAPDVAKQLAHKLTQGGRDRPFSTALCEVMSQHAGERIAAANFALDKLPEHLRFLVQVVDDEGKLLDSGRDLPKLQAEFAPPALALGATDLGETSDWTNRPVTPNDFDELPQQVTVQRSGLRIAAFPALVDTGTAVEMRLADTPGEAEQWTAGGLTRLFALKHHRALRSQVAHLPGLSAHCVRLGHLLPGKDLSGELQDLIARIALVEGQSLIRTREDFEARNARASGRISVAAQEVADWLPKLAEQVQQLRLLTERAPQTWAEVFQDLQQQQQALLHPRFLRQTPWSWLTEYPRYLQAMRQRIEKLKSGGLPKDRKLREPVEAAWGSYQEFMSNGPQPTPEQQQRLEELRWMIEELRVSIFAQQLGTRVSVSPKRVQALVEQCRQ